MKICSQCEAINADESQFCSKCGAQLGASQQGAQNQVNDPSHSTNLGKVGEQPQPHGTMGFSDAVRVCMKEKYASFAGRATRAEYWYFVLFGCLVSIGASMVGAILLFLGFALSGGDVEIAAGLAFIVYGIIYCIFILGFICPSISVLVRRLHDTGRSGWWYWIIFIPYIGSIVILIFALLASQEHDNEYGPYVKY